VGYTKSSFGKLSLKSKSTWKYHTCKAPPKNDDNTPVKSMLEISPSRPRIPSITTGNMKDYFKNLESSLSVNLMYDFASLIEDKLKSALAPLKLEISKLPELLKSVEYMSEKFDTIYKEVTDLRNKTKELISENVALKQEVKVLSSRVSQIMRRFS
jgi:FtsZ-binding cell division protein ZapB